MNTTPFDTQKIRVELSQDLQKAEQDYTKNPTLEHLSLIRWIQNKLDFLSSPIYQERKRKAQS